MFKRRTELPPRPRLPEVSQIIQDLESISDDDPILDDLVEKSAEELDMIKKAKELVSWHTTFHEVLNRLSDMKDNFMSSQQEVETTLAGLKSKASDG